MDPYQKAYKRMRRKRRFVLHATVFLFGSLILFLVNFFLVHTFEPWFIVPVGMWAILLAVHGFFTFTGILTEEWEESEVEKEMHRITGESGIGQYKNNSLELPEMKDSSNRKQWDESDFV